MGNNYCISVAILITVSDWTRRVKALGSHLNVTLHCNDWTVSQSSLHTIYTLYCCLYMLYYILNINLIPCNIHYYYIWSVSG
jgi:hypothetical protein